MKHVKPIYLAFALIPILLSGCASETVLVDPNRPPQKQFTSNVIDNNDCKVAAKTMIDSLISKINDGSIQLESASNPKALLAVSRIVVNVGQQIDTDMLTEKIVIALNNTGKVEAQTDDKLAAEVNTAQSFINQDKPKPQRFPDYTLSGKIIQDRIKQGGVTQNTYLFQLRLNSTTRAVVVWQDEVPIIKQTSRGGGVIW